MLFLQKRGPIFSAHTLQKVAPVPDSKNEPAWLFVETPRKKANPESAKAGVHELSLYFA